MSRSYFHVGLWEQGAVSPAMAVSALPSQFAGQLWFMSSGLSQLQA